MGYTSLAAWTRSLKRDAKKLAELDVAAIDINDIKHVVMPMYNRGAHVAARLTLSRIEAVFDCADANGWRSADNPASWRKWKHIAPKRESDVDRRHKAVDWRAAPEAFSRLRDIDSTPARAVELCALTAVRLTEARAAKWSEFDFENKVWTIPAARMKMRRKTPSDHDVPLSTEALALIETLKAKRRIGQYVFAGLTGSPVARISCWDVLSPRHGAARMASTFRSWCGDHGVDDEVAESALAHSPAGIRAIYNRAKMIERRRPAMQAWADHVTGKTAAKVVPFTAKGAQ